MRIALITAAMLATIIPRATEKTIACRPIKEHVWLCERQINEAPAQARS